MADGVCRKQTSMETGLYTLPNAVTPRVYSSEGVYGAVPLFTRPSLEMKGHMTSTLP